MSATSVTPPTAAVRIPRELWVLVAAAFVIALGFGLILPVLPQFAQSFGVGATASAIVVSAFAFFRLLFAPAGGRLIARFGERPIYLAGLVIVAISTGATAFAHTYWQLLLYRGLGGIGSVMFTVSAVALIVRLAPPAIRARVSSVYASAFLFGGILGPVVGGLLGNLGLRVPFLVYAVALLVAASLVAIFISGSALRPAEGAPVLPVLAVRDAWRDIAYRASIGSAFANGWANFGVRNAILPLFAAVVIGKEPWVAGTALAVFAAGNADRAHRVGAAVRPGRAAAVHRRGPGHQRAGDDRHRVRVRPAGARRAVGGRRVSAPACSTRPSRPPSPTSSGASATAGRPWPRSRCPPTAARSSGPSWPGCSSTTAATRWRSASPV